MGDMLYGFLTSAGSTRLMYRNARLSADARYRRKRLLNDMQRRGLVDTNVKGAEVTYFLTPEGKAQLHKSYQNSDTAIKKNAWDGSWWIVAYDFPETERSARNSLRYVLERAQFLQIQKSLWIFPYPNTELEKLLKQHKTVAKYCTLIHATTVANDSECRKHFKLP